ncbi:uncharacterized protein LOC120710765 [Panicum virgatum]|uniref:LysM domain-containing protein n=1 Tax=Panicum virgatum TaxID=38727 RepID=A0A8T0SRJ4_PANVG|nr:uncharacterized protein LOC120710765 [Panicum virgatum]KAG2601221.1 hypothetical protein PVAP13_5KG574200 [Panicum virgatum]
MAKHGAAAALLVASLLVAAALAAGTDARRPLNARLAINRGASRVFAVHEEAVAAVPTLSCSKVHGVQAGETCFTVAQAEGLTQDVFLSFNPNINCQSVFVGQWVCLAATSA